jgi:PBP1b-binding outer membrane lipoprotein LpoB
MPAAPAAPRAPSSPKITKTTSTPKRPKIKSIAQQVAEMVDGAQTRQDVHEIKKFIDTQGKLDESILTKRSQILEHATKLVALRRRICQQ